MTWMAIIVVCRADLCFAFTGPVGQPAVWFNTEKVCKQVALDISWQILYKADDPALDVYTRCVDWSGKNANL